MKALRTFLSVISMFALWFFITVLSYFFILSQILQVNIIKSWLSSEQGYEKITLAIKEALTTADTEDQVMVKISTGLTPELVQKQTETAIDKYFNYMKGDKSAMVLSSKEINDQLLKNLNITESELPPDMKQLLPELKLPLADEKNFERVNRFYHWVYLDQPYILGIIIFLWGILLICGSSFKNKMTWWLWSIIPPMVGMLLIYLTSSLFRNYFLKSDNLFSALSGPIKEVAYTKVRSLVNLLQVSELKVLLVELTVTIVFLLLYIIAGVLSKSKAAQATAPNPATPVAPPSSTNPTTNSTTNKA